MSSQRVVIIGAGIVGVNLADELASRGWTNVTVIEQGPLSLPGGSTSHAPGLIIQTAPSKSMALLARYTVEKLLSLEKDGQSCMNQVGSLEIASTVERLQELKRKHGYASAWGIDAQLLNPEQCLELHPYLNKDLVLGGYFVPSDGLGRAAKAVQLLIERTRQAGVHYLELTPVTAINQAEGNVTGVETPSGTVPADIVVCCAGFWGVEVGKMAGISIPLLPLAHQYAKTANIPGLDVPESPQDENGARLPALRYQDEYLYFRQHGERFGIGSYAHRPKPVDAATLGPTPRHTSPTNMPSRLDFTPEDFKPVWGLAQEILPVLRKSEIVEGFNGIFSFTPDGNSIFGAAPNLDGFYVAEAIWVIHSAGFARAMAQLLTTGSSDIDLSEFDLSRFEDIQLNPAYINETSEQSYRDLYSIIHPLEPRASPRNLRISPFYNQQCNLKAVFFDGGNAWERPQWYDANSSLVRSLPASWDPIVRDPWSARYYSPAVSVEAWKTRTAVAMYDLTSMPRLHVSGPGAVHLLQRLTTSDIFKPPGAVIYTLLLTEKGTIRAEVMVSRLDEELFQVGHNSQVDVVYLQKEARKQSKKTPHLWAEVRSVTSGTCCIGLWGPNSSDIMRKLSDEAFNNDRLPYYNCRKGVIAGIPVTVMRLSYVGEHGWEIHTNADVGSALWTALWDAGQAHGVVAAGRAAFNTLRMEKGFRFFGVDMTTEHDPYEAGLGSLVQAGKQGYVGEVALKNRSRQQPARRLRLLTVDNGRSVVMGKEPVFYEDRAVGYVTSASFGYSVWKPLAYAWLPSTLQEGQTVAIEYFGKRIKATVTPEPAYDPQMKRTQNSSLALSSKI